MFMQNCQLTFASDGSGLTLIQHSRIQVFSIGKKQKSFEEECMIKQQQKTKVIQIIIGVDQCNYFTNMVVLIDNNNNNSLFWIMKEIHSELSISLAQITLYRLVLQDTNVKWTSNQLQMKTKYTFFLNFQSIYTLDLNSFGTQILFKLNNIKTYSLKIIEKDFFVDKILLFQVSTKASTEIITIQDITYLITYRNNSGQPQAKKNVGTLKGHQDTITYLTASPSEGVLAFGGKDRLIKLWAIKQNESFEIQQAHSNPITSIAYSQDGQLLASASDAPIFLWDVIDKKLIIQLKKHETQVKCLEFSHCSKYLVSGDNDGIKILWNIEIPQVAKFVYIREELYCPIHSISISKQEQYLFVISNQDIIIKWEFEQIEKQQKEKILCNQYKFKPIQFYWK
ncbi:unnamed protein product (macronuclear) [Paramecium tetraurelia]|uniref:WD repeat-containing protein 75 second beta-propeller domain-containing protein n=1 Tax=Paramecium tetraurelia TaxID=5888 RepID=A0DRW6_PARTE|nr:uncharacterized protein GSPATT00019487001 [Paramecium tetraurelia]CAK85783.1 unnamed protein product [Paramecium tetraurelia]|eukprot:XP_001453180.1 hypothetical protein (macronuclear) [Paramecium tetraurelia strain d4-2]